MRTTRGGGVARCAEGVGGTRQRSSSSRCPATRSSVHRSSAPQRVHGLPVPVSAGIARESRCTSSAQPGQTQPGRQAAMPALCRIGTGAHCISGIRVRNEFNSGCAIDGCDAVAAQEGNPWRRTGLRCIIGGECTERVVADCRANRLAGGAFWEGDTVELAEGAECRIICPGPGSRRAIRAATMATQGAQEITGTGGLRPVPPP